MMYSRLQKVVVAAKSYTSKIAVPLSSVARGGERGVNLSKINAIAPHWLVNQNGMVTPGAEFRDVTLHDV